MLKAIFSFFYPRNGVAPDATAADDNTHADVDTEDMDTEDMDDGNSTPPRNRVPESPSPPNSSSRIMGKRARMDGTPGRSSLRPTAGSRSAVATPKGKGVVFAPPPPPSARKYKSLPRRSSDKKPADSKYWTYISSSEDEDKEGETPSPSKRAGRSGVDGESSTRRTRRASAARTTPQQPRRTARSHPRPHYAEEDSERDDRDDVPPPTKRPRIGQRVPIDFPASRDSGAPSTPRSKSTRAPVPAAPAAPTTPRRGRSSTLTVEMPTPRLRRPKAVMTEPEEDTSAAIAGPSSRRATRKSLPAAQTPDATRHLPPRRARSSLPAGVYKPEEDNSVTESSAQPTSTPRRRGRPRKSEPAQPAAASPAASRGRGRPSKAEAPRPPGPSSPRRPVGRPRKSEPAIPTMDPAAADTPRRRGRPPKASLIESGSNPSPPPTKLDPKAEPRTPRSTKYWTYEPIESPPAPKTEPRPPAAAPRRRSGRHSSAGPH